MGNKSSVKEIKELQTQLSEKITELLREFVTKTGIFPILSIEKKEILHRGTNVLVDVSADVSFSRTTSTGDHND